MQPLWAGVVCLWDGVCAGGSLPSGTQRPEASSSSSSSCLLSVPLIHTSTRIETMQLPERAPGCARSRACPAGCQLGDQLGHRRVRAPPPKKNKAPYLGMQLEEDPSISQVANRFMGTGLLSAPLPGKLRRPLLSAMVRAAGGTVRYRAAGVGGRSAETRRRTTSIFSRLSSILFGSLCQQAHRSSAV